MRQPRKVTVDDIQIAIAAELQKLSASIPQFYGREDTQGVQCRSFITGQIGALDRVKEMIRNRKREL